MQPPLALISGSQAHSTAGEGADWSVWALGRRVRRGCAERCGRQAQKVCLARGRRHLGCRYGQEGQVVRSTAPATSVSTAHQKSVAERFAAHPPNTPAIAHSSSGVSQCVFARQGCCGKDGLYRITTGFHRGSCKAGRRLRSERSHPLKACAGLPRPPPVLAQRAQNSTGHWPGFGTLAAASSHASHPRHHTTPHQSRLPAVLPLQALRPAAVAVALAPQCPAHRATRVRPAPVAARSGAAAPAAAAPFHPALLARHLAPSLPGPNSTAHCSGPAHALLLKACSTRGLTDQPRFELAPAPLQPPPIGRATVQERE